MNQLVHILVMMVFYGCIYSILEYTNTNNSILCDNIYENSIKIYHCIEKHMISFKFCNEITKIWILYYSNYVQIIY